MNDLGFDLHELYLTEVREGYSPAEWAVAVPLAIEAGGALLQEAWSDVLDDFEDLGLLEAPCLDTMRTEFVRARKAQAAPTSVVRWRLKK